MGAIKSVFQAIGAAIMAVVNGIAGILKAILNGIVSAVVGTEQRAEYNDEV
ncbi:hypothetical protein SLS56_003126 [Neofusicoccum ribis]|uniref:Uncharacterized protein n=1 Tax=Neofusicoccum ribis TaxID=45134 RepID=A0ABR3T0E8_9PEZI